MKDFDGVISIGGFFGLVFGSFLIVGVDLDDLFVGWGFFLRGIVLEWDVGFLVELVLLCVVIREISKIEWNYWS